jgi:molybdopterin-binding protein
MKGVSRMKVDARNQLIVKVKEIKKGDVMSLARFNIPAESCTGSVMTTESLKELELKNGYRMNVIGNAGNVLLVKEGK